MESLNRRSTRKSTRRKSEFFSMMRSTTLGTPRHLSIKEEEVIISNRVFEKLAQIMDHEKTSNEAIHDTFV